MENNSTTNTKLSKYNYLKVLNQSLSKGMISEKKYKKELKWIRNLEKLK